MIIAKQNLVWTALRQECNVEVIKFAAMNWFDNLRIARVTARANQSPTTVYNHRTTAERQRLRNQTQDR